MPRPKGIPKTGGRKAGTPNQRTKELLERIAESGKDPLDVLIEFLEHEESSMRLAAAKELMQYAYPKRKAIEHSGEVGSRKTLVIKKPDGSGLKIVEGDDDN